MFKQIAAAAILVLMFTIPTMAQQRNIFDVSGVRNSSGSNRLNEMQLQTLLVSLRQKTGFVELGFDQNGALTLGNRQNITSGSATARALLAAAVDSANLYELESHERSPDIAFARLRDMEYRISSETGKQVDIYQAQIDFADFDCLRGPREAKASMDVGLVLLHELAHGVLKLQDPPVDTDEIGECDAHVNQMRRELQLPERLYYHPGVTVARFGDGKRIVSARLVFVKRVAANAQPSAEYSLNWLPSQVAPNARNIAGFQQGSLEGRRR
jgi:hypothetical protein